MAVILVLGLLAITVAISYATLRGQATATQLTRNGSRGLDAREAARSGVLAALRKISEDGWAGVDAPISANVTNHAWYEVSFSTGDARLAPGDLKYGEYPFRLTINSTGHATDPRDANVKSVHQSRCVVQLSRRALVSQPANWNTLTNFTVYQWGNRDVRVQFPVRVSGRASILGRIYPFEEYPEDGNALEEYLRGLRNMHSAGLPDHRPFESPLTLALSRQSGGDVNTLTDELGLTIVDTTASTANPLEHPGAVSSYRLYPGGKEYTIPVIQALYGSTIQNVTLAPDPLTNPLGIFRSSGGLNIQNNVRLTGTLITSGSLPEVQIYGRNVVLEAFELPKLSGSNQVYRLPVALVRDSLRINSAADAQITGFTMVWNDFELKRGATTTRFALQGNLAAAGLLLRGREPWTLSQTEWQLEHTLFEVQLANVLNPNRVLYFPEWMERQRGFTVQPALTFQPRSSGVQPHWHDWSRPVYEKGSGDLGLKWELVRWEEGQ
jgi:hypothetical protein